MRTKKILAWMMAIAITSITLTACSHDKEVENSSKTSLRAYGLSPSGTHSSSILFTDDDIEWFDVNTREIKFKDMSAPLYECIRPFNEIEFYLGENSLFVVSSFVGLWDSRIFEDLVLCYGNQESTDIDGKYYLYDCYPLQYLDTEAVIANQKKNALQWDMFISYLRSKGKLKK